jgi:cation-transporting ATPase 13A3/4/5
MNAAGRVNIIVLDKTGTLTEEGLELYGFQTTRVVPFSLEKYVEFDDIEQSAKILNIVHKEFWKRYCIDPNERVFEDYKNALQNNMVYFVECLATCHSIDKLKGETLGNSVDKKIYDTLGWIQEKSSSVLDNENGIVSQYLI